MRYIVSLAVIIACFLPCHAQTLGEMRASIRYKIQDVSGSSNTERWTDAELNKRINSIQRFISVTTRCIYATDVSTPTAGVREYAKPVNCIAIDRVSFMQTTSTTSYKKLEFKTMGGLDRDIPSWEQQTEGLPRFYYQKGNYIGFERPVSAVYASTGALKIDYYKYPEDMVSDSDEPYDGEDYLQVYSDPIVWGVSYQCKQDEMKTAEAQSLYGEYVALVNVMIESINRNTDNPVQKIIIGR